MNQHELRAHIEDKLLGLEGRQYAENRRLIVSVNRGNYGNPSSAILEWQGSPTHTRTFVVFSESTPRSYVVYCGGRNFNISDRVAVATGELIYHYLNENGYLGRHGYPKVIRTLEDATGQLDAVTEKAFQAYKAGHYLADGFITNQQYRDFFNRKIDFAELCRLVDEFITADYEASREADELLTKAIKSGNLPF